VISPPRLLSILDAADGGGASVQFAGSRAFGTHEQRLDVWRPKRSARPLPVVVFFYGGGWVKGTRAGYAFAGKAFASQGFVAVVPDYRKVPDVRFPAFLRDGAEAVRWTRDHAPEFGGDPTRIALAGHSAGAYTAAMLALDRRWLAAEGLPPDTIKAAIGLSGPYDFYPFTSQRAIDALGNAADPRATQPITFARADAPPMLLVTSTGDIEVRPRNAEALEAKLRTVGAPVTLRIYAGLSHEAVAMALSRPFRGKAPVLADSAAFLHAHLKQ
jgi:acetyl esterase/lipase